MTQETKQELNELYLSIKSKIDDENEPEAVRDHNRVKLDLIMQLSRILKKDAYKSAFMQKLAINCFIELCNDIKTMKKLQRKKIISSKLAENLVSKWVIK